LTRGAAIMRIHISADIEGVAGVIARDQLGPAGFDYAAARVLWTQEVLAVIEGARTGGADEIVVSDSHGNGQTLLIDRLPAGVQLVRGWPRPLLMMQGIEEGEFGGAILLGYHAGAGNIGGGLSHTLSSRGITSLRLNGNEANEATLSAATAAHFGVPVVMASGDDVFVDEFHRMLPECGAVVTKTSHGTFSGRSLAPIDSATLLRETARKAVHESRAGAGRLFELSTPIEVEISLKYRFVAELLDYLAVFDRTGPLGIRFTARDVLELNRILAFILFYRFDER
jgi:D-amino peptidase